MECSNAKELITLYIDGRIEANQKAALEEHVSSCGECLEELVSLKDIISSLNDIEQLELPEGYHNELMRKIKADKSGFSFRRYAAAAAGVILTVLALSVVNLLVSFMGTGRDTATGNGTAQYNFAANSNDAGTLSGYYSAADEAEASSSPQVKATQLAAAKLFTTEKIEKNVSIEIKVEDITEAVRAINMLNGYNTSSDVSYYNPEIDRQYGWANITRRVNVNELDYVRDVLRSIGEVVNESEYQTNYTDRYDELSVMAANAENEIRRLGGLIEKSTSLDNIIYVENRISDINMRLDSYLGSMRQIAAQTSEPYISITITAQRPYEFTVSTVSFSQRMEKAFKASYNITRQAFEGLTVFLVSSIVPLAVVAVIILVVIFIIRRAAGWKK